MFADDLCSYYASSSLQFIKTKLNIYLKELEEWLTLWRLNMCSSKCSYVIFHTGNRKVNNIDLKLFGKSIPRVYSTTFLGVTFDSKLTFKEHIYKIRAKCIQRFNILKILKNKSWHLNEKTLVQIYYSLIRSIIEYASPIYSQINNTYFKKIKAIQNNSIRIIFKKAYDTSTSELLSLSGITGLKDRLEQLSGGYIRRAILSKNPFITLLCEEFMNKNIVKIKKPTLLCSHSTSIKTCLDMIN